MKEKLRVLIFRLCGGFQIIEQMQMRNELLEENYNNLKAVYESNAKLCHDFKHHIRTINELIDKNQIPELRNYISEFELETLAGGNIQWTEDTVVNFILNNKISMGKQKGIKINADIDYPVKTNILPRDITTIIANLFDNALEACDRISEEGKKWICISIKSINNMLMIKLENSCYEKPVKKGEKFITHKANRQMHGWGLKSIESTVQKYDGSIICDYNSEQQAFRSVVNMSFQRVELTKEYRGVNNDKNCYL
jgi:sensor histidine kinase regulating citrate/malate metabolism